MKTSERVSRMMDSFISERNEGKSIVEIAREYRITPETIYGRLQEIADANNVSRESLLDQPHKKHKQHKKAEVKSDAIIKVSPDEINEEVQQISEQIKLLILAIDDAMKHEEEIL